MAIPAGHVIEMRYFEAPAKQETPEFQAALDAIFAEMTTDEIEKAKPFLARVPKQMKKDMDAMLIRIPAKEGADFLRKYNNARGAALGESANPPLVVDVDTGVTYAQHSHFRDMDNPVNGVVADLPLEVRTDRPMRVVRGRVTRAQVVWIVLEVGASFPQTTIFFEPA